MADVRPEPPQITQDPDITWAAGLYEGEGSAAIGKNGQTVVCLGMTNEWTVHKFHEAMGVGKVYDSPRRPPRKKMYVWRVHRRNDVIFVLELLLSTGLLSPTRVDQAKRVLDRTYEISELRGAQQKFQRDRQADLELLKKVGLIDE
jgi:hypothetical protein